MLRAIIKYKHKCSLTGLETEQFESIDFKNDEIEGALRSGGHGEDGYDYRQFVGLEVLRNADEW